MWDRPRVLNLIANFLYGMALLILLYAALYAVVHMPIFPLRQINVQGQLDHVTRDQFQLIANQYLKGNFFTLDLVQAQQAFQKLPWARNVSLHRQWPDRLDITVEEHQTIARWGNIALVDTYGELFNAATDKELPVFYGPADGAKELTQYYAKFATILQKANLKVAELVLNPRRAWEITTRDGLKIELGRENMEARLQRFVDVYAMTLQPLKGAVRYVDLRYQNGFAVRKPESVAQAVNATPEAALATTGNTTATPAAVDNLPAAASKTDKAVANRKKAINTKRSVDTAPASDAAQRLNEQKVNEKTVVEKPVQQKMPEPPPNVAKPAKNSDDIVPHADMDTVF